MFLRKSKVSEESLWSDGGEQRPIPMARARRRTVGSLAEMLILPRNYKVFEKI